MDRFDEIRMNYGDAGKYKGLIEQVAGVSDTLKVLICQFTLTDKGTGLMVMGTQDTAMLHAILGEPFEEWINQTAEALGQSAVVRKAISDLHQIISTHYISNSGDNGGGENG